MTLSHPGSQCDIVTRAAQCGDNIWTAQCGHSIFGTGRSAAQDLHASGAAFQRINFVPRTFSTVSGVLIPSR